MLYGFIALGHARSGDELTIPLRCPSFGDRVQTNSAPLEVLGLEAEACELPGAWRLARAPRLGPPCFLSGGGALLCCTHSSAADVVDVLTVGVDPVLLGGGPPMFVGEYSAIDLHLTENADGECGEKAPLVHQRRQPANRRDSSPSLAARVNPRRGYLAAAG